MEAVPFAKMSGCGNDFILIDNCDGAHNGVINPVFVRAVCRRRLSIGADGLIVIEPSRVCDFAWRFFNADGSEAEMCGNGARCAARFAVLQGIAPPQLSFETLAGVVQAAVRGDGVRIGLPPPGDLQLDLSVDACNEVRQVHFINSGVPHVVCFVQDLESVPVRELGAALRRHERFSPAGANVNFVSHARSDVLEIRTYERGVEDETLACGTGAVACALVALARGVAAAPVQVLTRSGESLRIAPEHNTPPFGAVHLEGGARLVCRGRIEPEAWNDQTDLNAE